jgi:sodium/hydrogen antiporter
MDLPGWFAIGGGLLLLMALGNSLVARLPFSSAMLYLGAGIVASPWVFGWTDFSATSESYWIEPLAEVVVIISLFTSGLKLSVGLQDRRWIPSLRLASVSMIITVMAVAIAAHLILKVPIGLAILLGGLLAPTDPVLASDVQVTQPKDRDQLRFALTGEGGLNDGTAFPAVVLGLGLTGLHDLGTCGWRWLAIDVFWAIGAGVLLGALLGYAVGQVVLFLRREYKEAVGLDNFLALGLIGATYGIALLLEANGFLAVFAAGAALRKVERQHSAKSPVVRNETIIQAIPSKADKKALATHPELASAYMASAVLSFNEQLDRIGEAVAVIVVGMLLWSVQWDRVSWWFVLLLLVVIRPVAVTIGLWGSETSRLQRGLISWFGIRGIGSIYYLAYVLNRSITPDAEQVLIATVLSVVMTSIVVHGLSVTPLMSRYKFLQNARPPKE